MYGLRADGTGNIWASTNFGLARLDPKTSAIQRFHRLHGLQAEEFNFGAHYRDRSGKLYFGGAAGFNSFYPEVLQFNERPPRVVLTQFLKLNSPGMAGVPEEHIERLSLSHKEDVITLKFAALDYADPRANRYEYKLDGFDTDWVRADERRAATYTNLPGGHYVFRVRASNSDGVWSTQDLALPIDVAPSPWLSPWAYAGYALLAVLMLLGVWYAQQRRIARAAAHRRNSSSRSATAPSSSRSATASSKTPIAAWKWRASPTRSPASRTAAISCSISRGCWPNTRRTRPRHHDHRSRCAEAHQRPARPRRAATSSSSKSPRTLRQAIRPDDMLVRWGGDEFVVVAHAQHVEHASMLAERVRERVAKMKCVLPRGAVVRTSCSSASPACRLFRETRGRELGTRHQDCRPGAVSRQARPQCLARLVRHRIRGHR